MQIESRIAKPRLSVMPRCSLSSCKDNANHRFFKINAMFFENMSKVNIKSHAYNCVPRIKYSQNQTLLAGCV